MGCIGSRYLVAGGASWVTRRTAFIDEASGRIYDPLRLVPRLRYRMFTVWFGWSLPRGASPRQVRIRSIRDGGWEGTEPPGDGTGPPPCRVARPTGAIGSHPTRRGKPPDTIPGADESRFAAVATHRCPCPARSRGEPVAADYRWARQRLADWNELPCSLLPISTSGGMATSAASARAGLKRISVATRSRSSIHE